MLFTASTFFYLVALVTATVMATKRQGLARAPWVVLAVLNFTSIPWDA